LKLAVPWENALKLATGASTSAVNPRREPTLFAGELDRVAGCRDGDDRLLRRVLAGQREEAGAVAVVHELGAEVAPQAGQAPEAVRDD
jgi:hypothetical protein